MGRAKRKKTLRGRIEQRGVNIAVLGSAGWNVNYKLPSGDRVDALETTDGPDDVTDYLESYGIEGVSHICLGLTYVYY